MDLTLEGTGKGTYTQGYVAPGFAASAAALVTSAGVRDRLSAGDDALALDSGRDRPLSLEVARRVSARETTSALLRTHASAGGSDRAGVADDGAVTYAHEGAPTRLSFQLTTVRRDGGPATFVSTPIRVRGGDRLRIEPADRALRRVRVEIRGADGKLRTRLLRNRGRARVHLRLGAAWVAGRQVSVPFRLSGARGRAMVGAVIRVVGGGRVLAHHSVAIKAGKGIHRISWRLPRSLAAGRCRVVVGVTAVARGGREGTVSARVSRRRVSSVHLN